MLDLKWTDFNVCYGVATAAWWYFFFTKGTYKYGLTLPVSEIAVTHCYKSPDHNNKCISPIHKRTTLLFILFHSNTLSLGRFKKDRQDAKSLISQVQSTVWANPFKHCCGLHVDSTSSLWHDVLATEDLMNPHISLCQVFLLSLAPRSTLSVFIMKTTRRS